jgi:hypothetical protein
MKKQIIATATASALLLGAVAPAFAETSLTGSANAVVNAVAQGYGVGGSASANADTSANASSSTGLGASIKQMLNTASGNGASSSAAMNGNASSTGATNASADLSLTRSDAMIMANASVTSAAQVKSADDLRVYVASQIRSDDNMQSVQSASDKVSVSYKQHARFLGFIPVTLNATADVDASGNVMVHYPWYSIFTVTDKAVLEQKVQGSVNAALGVQGSPSAAANGSASLTAQQQAEVVAAVRSAMKAAYDAASDTSANASGTVEAGAQVEGDASVQ